MTTITINEIKKAIKENQDIYINTSSINYNGLVMIDVNDITYIYIGKLEELNIISNQPLKNIFA